MDREPTPEQQEMEKARQELETEALIRRYNEGQNPMVPAEEPLPDEGEVPTHEVNAPQPSPDTVIDEENLGV